MPVVLSDLCFSFPDGRTVLSDVSAAFGPGRTGLIGVNGSGKSTLLRLIAGELRPTSGSVTVTGGDVGYLPQNLTLDTGAAVAGLLGIAAVRDAIRAIEGGNSERGAVRRGWPRLGHRGPGQGVARPGWAWPTSASTTGWGGCPAARRS